MKNGKRVLFGVLFGQVVQTTTFMLANNINAKHPAAFAIALGLFITLALFYGMVVMGCEMSEDEARRKTDKQIKLLQAQVENLKRNGSGK